MNAYTLSELEKRIGYTFRDKALLRQAITHSSFTNERVINKEPHYERLEFLGDAVLELISSEFFFYKYPDMPEGRMTKLRASAVCEQALAIPAAELELGMFMRFSKGEENTGGRERESIIADAVEAIIGAIYVESGYDEAKRFIERFVLNDLENKHLFYDAKSILQEKVQTQKLPPIRYELISESGPDHRKVFEVEVYVGEKKLGHGIGKSKKLAQQQAAYEALCKMQEA
ncbi:MAG: ribonuclease III [Lachnospiraceae bacterium]|nr:ribonuclease III [Lachnospiraceae bacterium]